MTPGFSRPRLTGSAGTSGSARLPRLARVPAVPRSVRTGGRLLCAILSVAFAALWLWSNRFALRASYAQGGGWYVDALAIGGQLRLVQVSDWPGATPSRWQLAGGDDVDETTGVGPGGRPGAGFAVWSEFGLEGASGSLVTSLRRHDREPAWPPQELTMATMYRSRGDTMAGLGRWISSPLLRFHGLRLPLWLPTAVLGAWPLGNLLLRLTAADRRRKRARRGWCGDCGYDRNWIAGPCPRCSAG